MIVGDGFQGPYRRGRPAGGTQRVDVVIIVFFHDGIIVNIRRGRPFDRGRHQCSRGVAPSRRGRRSGAAGYRPMVGVCVIIVIAIIIPHDARGRGRRPMMMEGGHHGGGGGRSGCRCCCGCRASGAGDRLQQRISLVAVIGVYEESLRRRRVVLLLLRHRRFLAGLVSYDIVAVVFSVVIAGINVMGFPAHSSSDASFGEPLREKIRRRH
mmetsp:Transcript_33994/g.82234  ORF Transcript_33994/g.82234 Transcript_33994/m.82234 type:complete len:210 (-) Transcript_33994:223-852(-)